MHDSLRNRPRLRGSLLTFTLFAGLTVGAGTAAPRAASSVTVVSVPKAQAAPAAATPPGTMLADEITRRLRRMGISFSRTRLPHPYDPIGEIC